MSFRSDMDRIRKKVRDRERLLYEACKEHVFTSVTVGSMVTGAPGQPVDSSDLLRSYVARSTGRRKYRVASGLPYAHIIEDNRRGAKLRSKVGGFHSIKLTRLGWRRIVAYEAKRMGLSGSTGRASNVMARDGGGRFVGNAPAIDVSG